MALPTDSKQFRAAVQARIEDAERISKDARKRGDEMTAQSADRIAAEWRVLLAPSGQASAERR